MWILLSLTGALFQSITGALNKKNLQTSPSSIHLIAFINYAVAGILLSWLLMITSGRFIPDIRNIGTFMEGTLLMIPFNIVAVVCGYRALLLAEYNYLAPWLAVTSILVVIPSFLFLGEVPTVRASFGIILIVIGAILIDRKRKAAIDRSEDREYRDKRTAKLYIFVVGLCFSVTPVGMKMMILESSPLFTAAIAHLSIAAVFLAWMIVFRKRSVIAPFKTMPKRSVLMFFFIAVVTGIGYAIANGSVSAASGMEKVSLVIAVKRVAPAFSFFIGYYFLHETRDAKRKFAATVIMTVGAVLVTLYRS